ncbi:hypothetical protein [Streptomyces sp. WAC 06738]|nr:hypothetical protein [Streptomyces sp. WAC 06738]
MPPLTVVLESDKGAQLPGRMLSSRRLVGPVWRFSGIVPRDPEL